MADAQTKYNLKARQSSVAVNVLLRRDLDAHHAEQFEKLQARFGSPKLALKWLLDQDRS